MSQSVANPFSTIEIADLEGLRKVLPHDLDMCGPHYLGRVQNLEMFSANNIAAQEQGRQRIEGHFYINKTDIEADWLDGAKGELRDSIRSGDFIHQLANDILTLDEALRFKDKDEASTRWGLVQDNSPMKVGEHHRRGWHQDWGCRRIYLIGAPHGTVILKDNAPDSMKEELSKAEWDDNAAACVETAARRANLIVEGAPGAIYLIGGKTWHRSPMAQPVPGIGWQQQPQQSRSCFIIFARQ